MPPLPAPSRVPRFDPPNILWYFGAIAATAAAAAVIGQTGSAHRGLWIFLVALAFCGGAAVLAAAASVVGWTIPGGVLTTSAVALIPFVTYGFEKLVGVSTGSDPFSSWCGSDFAIVAVTIAAGVAAFWLVRFGFVLLPVAVATVLAVEFLVPVFASHPSTNAQMGVLLGTGAALVVVGMLLDARLHRSAAFWWHVVGLFAIAEALTYYAAVDVFSTFVPSPISANHHAWAWVAMLVIGAALLLAAVPVGRATWAAFGVAGVYAPLLHYVADASSSWRLALVMVFVGVGLMCLGVALDVFGPRWRTLVRTRSARS